MTLDTKELYSKIEAELVLRRQWEDDQADWYKMRHNGLRRTNKPWPKASDMHFPLSDTMIEKLKPYYYEQLYATDVLATFVAKNALMNAHAHAAAAWFDYETKQNTNLEEEIGITTDYMLTAGRAICKVFWCNVDKTVCYDAIDPIYFVVPHGTKRIEKASWAVHIMHFSKAEYAEQKNYRQDPDFVAHLFGRSWDAEKEQEKYTREGITIPSGEDQVIVWEVWERNTSGKYIVHTFSPHWPEEPVRDPFKNPYDHQQHPFIDFYSELKGKGFYSPRGVPEKVASFETSLCKTWNEKLDAMTLYNRPVYTSERPIPNAENLQMLPGQIIPYALQAVRQAQPPVSWDQEMINTRMTAEQRILIPDFGIGQQINTSDRKTATEINTMSNLFGNVLDLRSRLFRRSLGRLYRLSWALWCQYKEGELIYAMDQNARALPAEVLKEDFFIEPRGGGDGVNKQWLLTKAVNRMQLFREDPYINQVELRRSVLILDDPELVPNLLQDPGLTQANQAEDQANELTYMQLGFPAMVNPSDDHKVHVITLLQYIQQRGQIQSVVDPIAKQRIFEHIQAHIQALAQVDSAGARQLVDIVKSLDTQAEPRAVNNQAAVPA